jgi:hypothetical protein
MQSRFAELTLTLCLVLSLMACTSRPPATNTTASDPNNPGSSTATPGGAMAPSDNNMAETAKPAAAAEPKPIVVPAGTVLTVRLGETLSSKSSEAGQSFSATLTSPVEAGGRTVIPAGATASGTVVAAHAAGKFKGASLLQIRLDAVTVNGRRHSIDTSTVARSEKGKGKRSAALIGGGAGAGALIGALAGGGKGAAIGALVGGGAGTAGSAFTGNRDVTLPAESAVSFQLEAPLQIAE